MKFDMSDVRVRWQLYRYHNRSHNGEIWLALQTDKGILLLKQTGERPHGSKLLGEIRTRIVGGEFVDDIIPLQQRSPAEVARLDEQAMQHRRYRAELYKSYSLAERLADLAGMNSVKVKQEKANRLEGEIRPESGDDAGGFQESDIH